MARPSASAAPGGRAGGRVLDRAVEGGEPGADRVGAGVGAGDRPASQDGSLTARGYTVVDAFVGWEHRRFEVLLTLGNVLGTAWREAQFGNASCTRREVQGDPRCMPTSPTRPGVTDVHFAPGNPRGVIVTGRLFL